MAGTGITGRLQGALVREGKRKLEAEFPLPWRGRNSRRLSGLSPRRRDHGDHAHPVSRRELRKEFFGDRTVTALAEHIGVSRATISRILKRRNAVTITSDSSWRGFGSVPRLFLEGAAAIRSLDRIAEKETADTASSCLMPPGNDGDLTSG